MKCYITADNLGSSYRLLNSNVMKLLIQVQLKTCLKLTNLCKHGFGTMATNVFNNKELR